MRLEPSEKVLRGLLAAAPGALLAINHFETVAFANNQAERLFGWPKAELVGQQIECLMPEWRLVADAAKDSQFDAGVELRARRKDGSDFPAEIRLSRVAEGALVAAAVRDVTGIRRTEQRFRAVLESAPDAIVGVDTSGRIQLVNAEAERIFGWSAPELVGQMVEMLVPDSAFERHVRHWAGDAAGSPRPRARTCIRVSARRKDGSTFPTEISMSALTDEVGAVLMVLAAVRDAGECLEIEAERQRRALAARRERSPRLEGLGQLAGGAAHDFNNLLGVILNYTALLARRMTDPADAADVAEIRAAAERAAALTRQLLTVARRDVVHPEPLEVNDIVRGVASMLDRTLGEHVELRLELATAPLIAVADRQQLEQIVLNLAINARDAMPSGGQLTLATEVSRTDEAATGSGNATSPARGARAAGAAPREVVLRVIDTGHGMAPEVMARAFEPFFTTKPRGQGTGLGLASVYGIVRQNGGEVTITSAPGEGTTVTVVLRGAGPVGAPGGAIAEAGAGGNERILLVEDEAALRIGTARILSEQGYEVLVAAGGAEALAVFDRELGAVDAVVTDVVMPQMRGDELARQLGQRRPEVPVIFMSGYDSAEPPLTFQARGRLLTKPVAGDVLLQAVREVLDG